MVWSDGEETGFFSVHARERGIAVHILPSAQLYLEMTGPAPSLATSSPSLPAPSFG